ncbi:uncharacterized protein LOC142349251 isoform X2 [Convolutriloba macropyga]|uniref:uncharacterized protein LOC142349251 isoform X2 n=1 Tax=Convolutriloba macropyga TaxID=536237 RepID=UPI003F51F03B
MSGWLSAGWYVRFSTGFLGVRSILLLVTLCMLIFTLFTNGQLNKSFCPSGFRIHAPKTLPNCFTEMKSSDSNLTCTRFQNYLNQNGYSFSDCPAALGNQLGVLAIGLAIYRHFGLKLVLDQRQKTVLKNAFDVDQICRPDGTSFCIVRMTGCSLTSRGKTIVRTDVEKLWEKGLKSLGEVPSDLTGKVVHLPRWPQYIPWLFDGYLDNFRQQIQFKTSTVAKAKVTFNLLRVENHCPTIAERQEEILKKVPLKESKCTCVVVHIRGGNYDKFLKFRNFGPNLPKETNYLQEAFKYTIARYKNAVFFVLGNTDRDIDNYLKGHTKFFSQFRVVQVSKKRQTLEPNDKEALGVDLAIISLADVVIMTYGTFGAFGAVLTRDKDEVILPSYHKGLEEPGLNKQLPRFTKINWTLVTGLK